MKMYKASYKGYSVKFRAPQPVEAVKAGCALIQSKVRQVVAKDVVISVATQQNYRFAS